MTEKSAILYHAGCGVCVEAESAGVTWVPAFVIDGRPFYVNFGAPLADLKG
ncbi:hypothetical protein VQH23_06075 [Pararoseomonas sp. SCSIO 73927]|uniref:hypothetical protein n=1 Tax=Pararoseomonas sp. SCSIO 73927 TaxID=3114537 RepID=UPI0030CDEE6C